MARAEGIALQAATLWFYFVYNAVTVEVTVLCFLIEFVKDNLNP